MIALTGANGFVGSAVRQHATTLAVPVRSLVRSVGEGDGADVLAVGDLAEGVPTEAFEGATAVVHAAARVHVMRDTAVDREAAFRVANVEAAMQVARAASRAGVARMVFVSTIKVLGEGTVAAPFSPADPVRPNDPYARSKAVAEARLQEFAGKEGLELIIIRPPLVYGPGARGNLLSLIRLVARGVPLPFRAINNRRSFVAVDALAELLLAAAMSPMPAGTIYHAADRHPVSTPDLVRAIAQGLDRPARLFTLPEQLINGLARVIGRTAAADRLFGSLEVDASASELDFAWQARTDTLDGIARMARAAS